MSNRRVVYNRCFGGFALSEAAKTILRGIGVMRYEEDNRPWDETPGLYDEYSIPRHHPDLVQVVELLGAKDAGDTYSELAIYELSGTQYRIEEYDGQETVVEPGGYSWITISD